MGVATMDARTGLEQAFVAAFRAYKELLGYTAEEFAGDYDIPVSKVKNVLYGRTRPTRTFVEDIADIMKEFLQWSAAHPFPGEAESHQDFRDAAQRLVDAAEALLR